jgi:hypothetical protein
MFHSVYTTDVIRRHWTYRTGNRGTVYLQLPGIPLPTTALYNSE